MSVDNEHDVWAAQVSEDRPAGGWTFETLRTYLCQKIMALDVLLNERFVGSDRFHAEIRAEYDRRYQQRFEAQQEAVNSAFLTAREALAEAKNASVVGFEKSNEWRQTLNDVVSTRVTRDEYLAQVKALTDKVDSIMARQDRYEGRSGGMGASWHDVLSIVAALAAVGAVAVVMVHK